MSFQAYLDNIETKTRKSGADFQKIAAKKGLTQDGKHRPDVKAGQIVEWLKDDFDLGRGHAMAIYALLKGPKSGGK
jgi:Domain of unknown function (DUF4287)